MLNDIITGFVIGFIMSFGFGVVFFTLLEKSLTEKYNKIAGFILGSWVADTILFFSGDVISSYLHDIPYLNLCFNIAAFVILLVMGYQKISRKTVAKTNESYKYLKNSFLIGFLLNFLNPLNLLTWLFLSEIYLKNSSNLFITFIVFTLTNWLVFSVISQVVAKNKKLLDENLIKKINIITAIVFVFASFKILYNLLSN